MTHDALQHDHDLAVEIVRTAALLARDIRRSFGDAVLSKTDRSPVTVADFAVQALVAHHLAQARPDDPLVAEEDAGALREPSSRAMLGAVTDALVHALPSSVPDAVLDAIDRGRGAPGNRFWTLDPIDGTQGFIRGDQYVVALALIVNGRVEVGVLGCPRLSLTGGQPDTAGSLVSAIRGRGTFCMPLEGGQRSAAHVSGAGDPRRARVMRSLEDAHVDVPAFNAVVAALGIASDPIRMDSQAKHAAIAAGQGDLLLRLTAQPGYREKIWDQAVGSLLIEEAGGRVTDADGRPLDFSTGRTLDRNRGVIASNGHLHAAVIDALRGQAARAQR